ncbi:MAG: hypothetical protein ACQESC_03920 [Nanobdellota archaeon]
MGLELFRSKYILFSDDIKPEDFVKKEFALIKPLFFVNETKDLYFNLVASTTNTVDKTKARNGDHYLSIHSTSKYNSPKSILPDSDYNSLEVSPLEIFFQWNANEYPVLYTLDEKSMFTREEQYIILPKSQTNINKKLKQDIESYLI